MDSQWGPPVYNGLMTMVVMVSGRHKRQDVSKFRKALYATLQSHVCLCIYIYRAHENLKSANPQHSKPKP